MSKQDVRSSGATPYLDPRLAPITRLWWLAEELTNTADAIGPVPDLAEKSLRLHADVLRSIVDELNR